jgi:Spy/CpxP family protein refolding chaperone
MKKTVRVFMLATLLLCFTAIAQTALAQGPPPPPDDKGTSTNKAPGGSSGSPIGNGTFILVALAAAYAGRKAYLVKNEKK